MAKVLHYPQTGNTITVRLREDLGDWLEGTAKATGVSQGHIIRDQLEKARAQQDKPFMRLAGKVAAAPDLSTRKGFSRS